MCIVYLTNGIIKYQAKTKKSRRELIELSYFNRSIWWIVTSKYQNQTKSDPNENVSTKQVR